MFLIQNCVHAILNYSHLSHGHPRMESNRRWLWRLLNAANVWGYGAATNAASILEVQSISSVKDLRRVAINIDKSLLASAYESYCDNKKWNCYIRLFWCAVRPLGIRCSIGYTRPLHWALQKRQFPPIFRPIAYFSFVLPHEMLCIMNSW